MPSTFYQDLKAREIIYQTTDASLEKHLEKPIKVYCGFDPTSDSLHIGSLFPLLTLRRFQLAGHTPIIVLGGATGMIGDPSGKSQERNLQTPEMVEKNLIGIRKVAEKFVDFDPKNPNAAIIVNNHDFYHDMSILTFLREVGKHFTINHMSAKDSVKSRMEDRDVGISYTEFSYMLLQAYDFYYLFKKYNCSLQIGGSDQWGNITAGTELIRRKEAHEQGEVASAQAGLDGSNHHPAYGLTQPLITKSDGTKFGKSEKGNVWLSSDKTSPFQFYQFFIQAPDDIVMKLIQYVTLVPTDELAGLAEKLKSEPDKKAAQVRLAQELTRLVHGEAALIRCERATKALFGTEIKELDLQTLTEVFADAPSTTKAVSELSAGIPLIDLLAETGLFASRGAAKKEIPAGGVYLNNDRVTDVGFLVKSENLIAGSALVVRKGKKNYHLVKFA
jgi:tyrosyl-tRNA synthetase